MAAMSRVCKDMVNKLGTVDPNPKVLMLVQVRVATSRIQHTARVNRLSLCTDSHQMVADNLLASNQPTVKLQIPKISSCMARVNQAS